MLIQPTGRKLLCVCQQPFWKRSRVKESKLSLNLEGGLCLSVIQYLKWRNTLINPGVWKALSQPFSSRLFQSLVAQMFKMNPYYVLSSFIKGCFYDNIFCATVLFFFEKHFKNYSWRTCFFQTMLLCLFNVAFPFIYPSGSSLPTFHFCISACFHEFNKSPCKVLQCFKWSSDVTQLVFINFIG